MQMDIAQNIMIHILILSLFLTIMLVHSINHVRVIFIQTDRKKGKIHIALDIRDGEFIYWAVRHCSANPCSESLVRSAIKLQLNHEHS